MLQDGKLVLDTSKKSLYRDFATMPPFAKDQILKEARRQIEAAASHGMSVEWVVSDATAAKNLEQLFKDEGVSIVVEHLPK